MGEQQQHKKRPRCSASAEGSGGKKSSVLALSSSPVATVAPSAPAAPSPVATAKPASTVAATSDPLAAMPPAQAAPSPAPTTEEDTTTPTATVVVTSPVAAMAPAAPSSAAIAKPAATVVDLEATSPVIMVKPEDEVAEQEDAAMAAGAAEDVEVAILALPKKSFHCAPCLRPLKPPVFRCENEHFVCHACGGDGGGANKHCGPCGRTVSYTHSRFMDGVVDAYKVPCLYKGHGCAMDDIPYHSAADHKASCKHAPCYCFDCRFVGSPAKLVRHLASPSGAHAWPVEKIRYEVPHPFVVPASSEDQRRLLVAEDGRVFLLAVGAGREPGGRRPVTVVCVRGNADADADAKPLFTGVLWVDGPPAPPRQPLGCSFRLKATVASCSVPGAVDMEHGWLHAHVSPNMLHGGESGELHLRLCLTKLA